jgi:UDPglucose 6-dehydrogenase
LRVSIIGCGHVGLVTGACLAYAGHHVICTDIDASRIAILKAGGVPFFEPHLGAVLRSARKAGRISFTISPAEAIRAGESIFICLGRSGEESGPANLSAIDAVARQIAQEARSPRLIIAKNSFPVLGGRKLQSILCSYSNGRPSQFRLASAVEFTREGTAVCDFFHPHHIVVGVNDPSHAADLRAIYAPILERRFSCPIHTDDCRAARDAMFVVTSIDSAELIKHASNSLLALRVSFGNVLADLCEKIGLDVDEVTRTIGLDPDIGAQFLKPGLGFGGSRLQNDLRALIRLSTSLGIDSDMLTAAERVNDTRVSRCIDKLRIALGVLKGKRVAVLGLAFQPNSDDVRSAPAMDLMECLLAAGAEIHASDPEAIARARAQFPQATYHADPYQTLRGSHAAIVCTDWDVFKTFDWARAAKWMARKLVIDGRNVNSHHAMQQLGFEYYSFGRGTSSAETPTGNASETPARAEEACA